ncbi:MAG: hypothetical protein ACXVA9_04640, partial [Bdellovibrionales bacterium]
MKPQLREAMAFLGPALLLLLLLCHSWFGPDIWYHLTWGQSLIAYRKLLPDTQVLLAQPIVANGYWLFQIIVTEIMQMGGIVAVSALFMVLWSAIACLWVKETEAKNFPFSGPLVFLGFIVCAQLRFEARPEIFSYFFLICEIVSLRQLDLQQRLNFKSLTTLFVLQALWTNCHGYFVLGPLLGFAMIASLAVDRDRFKIPALKRALAITAVLIAGSFVSPFPLGNWDAVVAYMGVSRGLRELNTELQPPALFSLYWPLMVFWLLWITATLFGLFQLTRRRESFAAFLALAGSLLAVQATRNIPLFLLMSAPLLRLILLRWKPARIPQAMVFLPSAIAALICVFVVRGDYHKSISSLGTFGIHLESSAYPIGATEFLRETQFRGKLFCDSYDGGYLEYHLPDIQISGDSYFSDPETTLNFFAAIRDPSSLRGLDARLHFDALLINIENQAVVDWLWSDPQWYLVYADSHRVLYSRRPRLDGLPASPESAIFYRGEDLTHWTYAFAMNTWAGMALKYKNPALMRALVKNIGTSPKVPSPVIRFAL